MKLDSGGAEIISDNPIDCDISEDEEEEGLGFENGGGNHLRDVRLGNDHEGLIPSLSLGKRN